MTRRGTKHTLKINTIRTPSRLRTPFRTRLGGIRRRKITYVCTHCGIGDTTKGSCALCGEQTTRFDSKGEALRYAQLCLLRDTGFIVDLSLQPKFKVEINGEWFCTYTADFKYARDGETIIEDYKGNLKGQDTASKLRRKAAELYHGMKVLITTG